MKKADNGKKAAKIAEKRAKTIKKAMKKKAAAEKTLIKHGVAPQRASLPAPDRGRFLCAVADTALTGAICLALPLKFEWREDSCAVLSSFLYTLTVHRDEQGMNLHFEKPGMSDAECGKLIKAVWKTFEKETGVVKS